MQSIADLAADPGQYDRDEVVWSHEGSGESPNRRLFSDYLRPYFKSACNGRVLDVGCGLGWACAEVQRAGGDPVGFDPSSKNIAMARDLHPGVDFVQATLETFEPDGEFDLEFAIMVENFADLSAAYKCLATWLVVNGRFVTIVSDFARSVRADSHTEVQMLGPDEAAIRITNPERFGVICDLIRPADSYVRAAAQAGLRLRKQSPIVAAPWHPRYSTHGRQALFHLLEFAKVSVS